MLSSIFPFWLFSPLTIEYEHFQGSNKRAPPVTYLAGGAPFSVTDTTLLRVAGRLVWVYIYMCKGAKAQKQKTERKEKCESTRQQSKTM